MNVSSGTHNIHGTEIAWAVCGVVMLVLSVLLIRNDNLLGILEGFGVWAAVILVVLKISTLVFAPLGGSPLYLIAGALFGSWYGFLIVFLGDIIGTALCFILGRRYGTRLIKRMIGEHSFIKVTEAIALLDQTRSFVKARIAFTGGPELLAYASGMSPISFSKFMKLHIPFYIPVDLIFVFLGSQIASLSAGYAFIPTGIVVLVSMTGFLMLLRDYENIEMA